MHLVAFIIRIYHNARSPERQIYHSYGQNIRRHRTTVQNLVARTISTLDICTPVYEVHPHPILHIYHIYHRALLLNSRIAPSELYVLTKNITLAKVAYFFLCIF